MSNVIAFPSNRIAPKAPEVEWWVEMADFCQTHAPLRGSEPDFLANIVARAYQPTDRQAAWLLTIFNRCRPRKAGDAPIAR